MLNQIKNHLKESVYKIIDFYFYAINFFVVVMLINHFYLLFHNEYISYSIFFNYIIAFILSIYIYLKKKKNPHRALRLWIFLGLLYNFSFRLIYENWIIVIQKIPLTICALISILIFSVVIYWLLIILGFFNFSESISTEKTALEREIESDRLRKEDEKIENERLSRQKYEDYWGTDRWKK